MAKQQSFADKANKLGKKHDAIVKCPDTGADTKIISVRIVNTFKSDKGTFKFLDRNMKVYESTYKPYKP